MRYNPLLKEIRMPLELLGRSKINSQYGLAIASETSLNRVKDTLS